MRRLCLRIGVKLILVYAIRELVGNKFKVVLIICKSTKERNILIDTGKIKYCIIGYEYLKVTT